MISRKAVLKTIRETVPANAWGNFSDIRKNHQRVKWYGSHASVEAIQAVIAENGVEGVEVKEHYTKMGNFTSSIRSIVITFPYNIYN